MHQETTHLQQLHFAVFFILPYADCDRANNIGFGQPVLMSVFAKLSQSCRHDRQFSTALTGHWEKVLFSENRVFHHIKISVNNFYRYLQVRAV